MIAVLFKNYNPIVEEPLQFVFYTGRLHGDLPTTLRVIQYYQTIIDTYPAMKVIFLGNYLNYNPEDFHTLTLLFLFYLKNPYNVVLLRGRQEFVNTLVEGKFWKRLYSHFPSLSPQSDPIITLYHSIALACSLLPFIHIGQMNQGKIRIFSSSSGIPLDRDDPSQPILIKQELQGFKPKFLKFEDLNPVLTDLLTTRPVENQKERLVLDPLTKLDSFNHLAFAEFLKANSLQFMLCGAEPREDGCGAYFKYLLYSLFSAKTLSFPDPKTFHGKIIRLTLGKPPTLS